MEEEPKTKRSATEHEVVSAALVMARLIEPPQRAANRWE